MNITKNRLRNIINSILSEQLSLPKRYNHNGFELFSEDDEEDSEDLEEIWAAQGFDGDDTRASLGGMNQKEDEFYV
jgi:hypothetical protein